VASRQRRARRSEPAVSQPPGERGEDTGDRKCRSQNAKSARIMR